MLNEDIVRASRASSITSLFSDDSDRDRYFKYTIHKGNNNEDQNIVEESHTIRSEGTEISSESTQTTISSDISERNPDTASYGRPRSEEEPEYALSTRCI